MSEERAAAEGPAAGGGHWHDYRAAAAAGIEVLQGWYSRGTGLWKSVGWWNAANALTAVIRYIKATGDLSHQWVIENTFTRAQRGFTRLQRRRPAFSNEYFDDNLWWALAWVAACDLTTGDEGQAGRYLDAARVIFAHSLAAWDDTCGGGLWWREKRDYKNAITNELFLTLAALLAARVPGNPEYRDWALREWEWLRGSGMIGPFGLVNDGITPACENNGGITWTYNQGVILGGLAALHELTGDQGYLRQGELIADATLRCLTSPEGILAEPAEEKAVGRREDQTQFKGIFIRYLHDFSLASGKPAYPAFILANADSVLANAGNAAGQYGLRWGGPFDKADASRQTSAVEALTAAAALTSPSAPAAAALTSRGTTTRSEALCFSSLTFVSTTGCCPAAGPAGRGRGLRPRSG